MYFVIYELLNGDASLVVAVIELAGNKEHHNTHHDENCKRSKSLSIASGRDGIQSIVNSDFNFAAERY